LWDSRRSLGQSNQKHISTEVKIKKEDEGEGERDERSFRQLFALHPKQLSHNIWVIKDTFIQIQIQYPYARCLTTRECHTDRHRSRYRAHTYGSNKHIARQEMGLKTENWGLEPAT